MRPSKPELRVRVVCPVVVQAPVTTAGIGYVVVTGPGARTSSGPLGSSSSSSSSRTASNSPTAESQVRSEVTDDAPLLRLASVAVDRVFPCVIKLMH